MSKTRVSGSLLLIAVLATSSWRLRSSKRELRATSQVRCCKKVNRLVDLRERTTPIALSIASQSICKLAQSLRGLYCQKQKIWRADHSVDHKESWVANDQLNTGSTSRDFGVWKQVAPVEIQKRARNSRCRLTRQEGDNNALWSWNKRSGLVKNCA